MTTSKTFAGIIVLLFSQLTMASTIILPSPGEPNLIGSGGILDIEFGLDNLLRIDDDLDQYWNVVAETVSVTAVAKHAGYSQDFGFITSDDTFTSLLYVPTMAGQSNTFTVADSGTPFRFGLDPSGAPLFSSDPSDNVLCGWHYCSEMDHMVSWLITGGQHEGDYVLAWEDLEHLGDRDYNDLVVRVSGVSVVPVPAAVWLFGSGLLGLAAVARRRR